jgi:hypothetical protein
LLFCGIAATLCIACTSKPADTDVNSVVAENIPKEFKSFASAEQIQTEVTASGDEVAVKFKTQLKLNQSLFEPIDFDVAAKTAGGDVLLFQKVSERFKALSPAGQDAASAAVQVATQKPVFLSEAHAVGNSAEWYGSFKAKKVVDRWVASDFKTEVAPQFKGRPRSEFPDTAVESKNASSWFADIKKKQTELLQKIDVAQKFEQKEAELAGAQAAAQKERAEKDALIAAKEQQARQMPLKAQFRSAALGETSVLRLQVDKPMTVRLDVTRGLQKFARDLQMTPGRVLEIGHLEGWGFKAGDAVTLSNPSFDNISFSAP